MNNECVYRLCLESTIPGILNAISNNSISDILDVVTKKANRDVMVGARFWDDVYVKKSSDYIEKLKEFIISNPNTFSSSNLISLLDKNTKSIGCIQKLVNMTLKYLYILQVYGYLEEYKICIKSEKCDCPLDRQIINKLYKGQKEKIPSWIKLDKNQYNKIQLKIS